MTKNMTVTIPKREWIKRIGTAWKDAQREMLSGILQVGSYLIDAKDDLEHGEFIDMVENKLPFTPRTARRLMAIARDERLKGTRVSHLLPPSWGTLYQLTRLDDEQFTKLLDDGTIRPDLERSEIASVIKKTRRTRRELQLGAIQCALPDRRYGVIVADPEWRFEPWSRETGMDRAADNHYPTSCTDVIASRPIASIAAVDCALFLWATIPMLPHALVVMAAWDFDYKSHYVWGKTKSGTGYWVREKHELLLVGTRGDIPCPIQGEQMDSLIIVEGSEHSAKPECFLEMIESYFPTLPKIELNRRGAPRHGWDAWGNEVKEAAE